MAYDNTGLGDGGAAGPTNAPGTSYNEDRDNPIKQYDRYIQANQWFFGPDADYASYAKRDPAMGLNADSQANSRDAELRWYMQHYSTIPTNREELKAAHQQYLKEAGGPGGGGGGMTDSALNAWLDDKMKGVEQFKAARAEQQGVTDRNKITSELNDFYKYYNSPVGANDPYAQRISQIAGGQARRNAAARGVQGGLSDMAVAGAASNALGAYNMQRADLAKQALGLASQHSMGIGELAQKSAELRQQDRQMMYTNALNQAQAQAAATSGYASATSGIVSSITGMGGMGGGSKGGGGGGVGGGWSQAIQGGAQGASASGQQGIQYHQGYGKNPYSGGNY